MRAALAHHGRRLLVSPARAHLCAAHANHARRRPIARSAVSLRFQRTFIGALFKPPPREVRPPDYEPGWPQITIWKNRMLDQVRPPRRSELIEAWKKFMQSKLKRRIPLNSTQALHCRRLLEYLTHPNPERPTRPLHLGDIAMARQVLLDIEPCERTQNHLDFAKALHSVASSDLFKDKIHSPELQWAHLVRMLCIYGGSQEAMRMLLVKWDEPRYVAFYGKADGLVPAVLSGLAREGKEKELLELAKQVEARGLPFDDTIQSIMVLFFAQRDRVPETQEWFAKPIDQRYSRAEVYRAVASFASRNCLQQWAMDCFLQLGQKQPPKSYWNVLLQALLLVGKGLGEVRTLMSHMVIRDQPLSPNINTINGLLRVALEMRDPSMAEGILTLGSEHSLTPNSETDLILLRLCLRTGDLEGARNAYEHVRYAEAWTHANEVHLFEEYRQMLNEYLVLLSQGSLPDFKIIMLLLEAVDEYQIVLKPETIAALISRFLEHDRHYDVMDMLSGHSFFFSSTQREVLQDCLMAFCLDHNTSTRRAWSGYQIISQFFPDLKLERREQLMEAFLFDRKRPDMATQIFGHMRQHQDLDYHPKLRTYVRYFEGLAMHPDTGLGIVHNMLKTDTTLQPTTKLYTAMMLAYTACDKPERALEFWTEITRSREGPSYASLEAVFWALERRPGGFAMAKEIWNKVQRMDLEVPPTVFNAYVGAVASSGNVGDLQRLITDMVSIVGTGPDKMTLGVAHNALRGQQLQQDFREWAKANYQDTWAQLSKLGTRQDEFRLCYFKIKREMKA
ncbi:hypothetical protein HIM_07363 [Hirsutella minnesotensis 3608]|uniref:Complex I intermediate-associated protein 84 n=1 Tax=Hirsutella minnesotensis 3608 TaxID=1043627 RepID=A0A0F7ZHV3_9HYPO|nr:hypothetical protein HIM_07363 [Hirsutella minnesotensis 3608]